MRRALLIVICAALLVAVVAANRLDLSTDDQVRPITTTGTIGQTVRTADYDIRVDRVAAGHWLVDKSDDLTKPAHTSGVFLVVWADLTALRKPVTLNTAYLRTADGHRYDTSGLMDFVGSLNQTDSQPGLTQYGAIGFELPPYRLAGARLVVGPAASARLSAQADVDLGLSTDAARRLVAQAHIVSYDKAVYR